MVQYHSLLALILSGMAGVCQASAAADDSTRLLHRELEHDGIEREYFVHLPAKGIIPGKTPMVIAIHGYTSTATGFAAHYGINQHADEHGYIVVYPQGTHFVAQSSEGSSWRVTSWNDLAANEPETTAGPHCTTDRTPYPRPPECADFPRCGWTSCHDDKGFLLTMLDELQAEWAPDANRIYILGVSNGAMMALRLGCDAPGRFAAVVSVIGQLAPGYACGPTEDTPMLHLYGARDDTVRYDGQPGGDGFIYTTARETAETWARALACQSGPVPWQNGFAGPAGVLCTAYTNCRQSGHEVVSCVDPDGTHEWPSLSVPGVLATCVGPQQVEAMPGSPPCPQPSGPWQRAGMDLVWSFLERFRKN